MRRLLAAVAAVAVAAACGLQEERVEPPEPPPVTQIPPLVAGGTPGPTGLIVFTAPGDEFDQLHAVLANGFGKHPLVEPRPPVDQSDPAFSPDGRLLAWLGTEDGTASVWVSLSDGTMAVPLRGTDGAACPSWALDAADVIFLDRSNPEPLLRRVTLTGVTTTVQVPFPTAQLGCAAPLPGDAMVVERRIGAGEVELWTFTAGSIDADRLVSSPGCRALDPVPSPDGAFVGFTTRCEDPAGDGLWMVPASGGVPAPVVHGPAGAFSWSPDGGWMVYAWDGVNGVELRLADTDGSDIHTLVEAPSGWPTWSPPPQGAVIAP